MTPERLRQIIDANGGPEKIILFSIVDGTRIMMREDYDFNPDTDIDYDASTIIFRGRSDIKGRAYEDVYDVSSVIGVSFASDNKGKEFDIMSVRG